MKRSIILVLAFAAVAARGQVLHTFDSFADTEAVSTYFSGTWGNGAGLPSPSLSQGSGFFSFEGGTNAASSGVDFYFLNATRDDYAPVAAAPANREIRLTAQVLAGNVAPTVMVKLFDSSPSQKFASATFSLSEFSATAFTAVSKSVTADAGFDWSKIQGFSLTGGSLDTPVTMNFSVTELSLTAPIPEPATYALAFGVLTLGFVGYRRWRRV